MRINPILLTLGVVLLVIVYLNWPLIMASGNAVQRVAEQRALELNGVDFCPKQGEIDFEVIDLQQVRSVTMAVGDQRFSPMVKIHMRPVHVEYDGGLGLCVLRIRPDGSRTVEFWPPMHLRPGDWRVPDVQASKLAFAYPRDTAAKNCVRVRFSTNPHAGQSCTEFLASLR